MQTYTQTGEQGSILRHDGTIVTPADDDHDLAVDLLDKARTHAVVTGSTGARYSIDRGPFDRPVGHWRRTGSHVKTGA